MSQAFTRESQFGLDKMGLSNLGAVHWNLTEPALYEHAVRRGEAMIAGGGPLVTLTGAHTGRSPLDKFVVREPAHESKIWWGDINQPIDAAHFAGIYAKMRAYFQGRDVYVQDCHAGADPEYRLKVRILTNSPYPSLFARNMFIQPDDSELATFVPDFTVIQAPGLHADPEADGTRSGVFILVSFERKMALIGGTSYAGEIKKSVFSVLNYLLPDRGVLPMHCSANVGGHEDVAIFFGLSGTGKTTLSADPGRALIGDDEHGWSDRGVYNFEGGCYAKVIRLSAEAEPQIHATTRRFGTVLENVVMDPATRQLDLDDARYTENTRASYPIEFIDGHVPAGHAGHPKNVFFLTCDAFGVLPPVSRLTPEQAMYHFLSGYTAKVAGTEKGVKDPSATFSTCFGAPFLPRFPSVYAGMLGDKIRKHGATCWLINTGWTGGPFGVGERMKIAHTRAMLDAALQGELNDSAFEPDAIFGLHVPARCPGVPDEVLRPNLTWSDQSAYEAQARKLAGLFHENFKEFEGDVDDAVRAAGPKI